MAIAWLKDLFKGRQTPPDGHGHTQNGHTTGPAAKQSAGTVSPANESDMERTAYWAGYSHLSRDEQLREWEAGMDRWLAGWDSDGQAFLKRLLRQNGQPVDSVTVSAKTLYQVFMNDGGSDIEFYTRRIAERNTPSQIDSNRLLIEALAVIYGPETAKRALPLIQALIGGSGQNGPAPSPFVLGTDPVTGLDLELSPDDLTHSLTLLGVAGSGKSQAMVHLARYHMEMGHSLIVIDPHGTLARDIIGSIPQDRMDDVDVLDLMDCGVAAPGINIFGCSDPADPTEVAKAASAVFHIFEKTWSMSTTTPLLAQVVRHICYAAIESGLTLGEVGLFLFSDAFRQKITAGISNQHTRLFWEQFNTKSPRQQAEYTNSTTNKLDALLTQPILANILVQKHSTIDLDRITREGRILILLLNQQFEEASRLVGNIVLTKLLLNAFARAERPDENHTPVALLVDEWQNFCSSSNDFARFIHESRKAKYMPCYANQSLSQLSEENIGAALSSGTIAALRINGDDSRIVSRSLDSSPQPVEVGVEPQRAPVADVIGHLVRRGHVDERVSRFSMTWLAPLEKYAQTPERQRHVASHDSHSGVLVLHDLEIARGRKLLNDALYTAQSERRGDIAIDPLALYVLVTAQGTTAEYVFSPYIDTSAIQSFGARKLRDSSSCSRMAAFGKPGFLTDGSAARFVAIQRRKRRWMAERIVAMLTELRYVLTVLASSPIMVDTGFMVPKYQLRSVSDQTNYIANTLSQMPLFHARVKTLHGECTIRLSPPLEPMRAELVQERIDYIKQRMLERGVIRPAADVLEELRKRHELLRGEANDAPPTRSTTATRRPRRRPQRDD